MGQNGLRMWGGFAVRNCLLCDERFLSRKLREGFCRPYCRDVAYMRYRHVWRRAQVLRRMKPWRFSEVFEAVLKVSKEREGPSLLPAGVAKRLGVARHA